MVDGSQTKVGVEGRERGLHQSVEVFSLGKIETKTGGSEQVMILKFINGDGRVVYSGVFIPEVEESNFTKWFSDANFENVKYSNLSQNQIERLSQFANLNIPPVAIFYLALNTELEYQEICNLYPNLLDYQSAAILAVASDQSGQGKTFLSTLEALKWGDSPLSGDMFTADSVDRMVKEMTASGWNRQMDGADSLSMFRSLRSGVKLEGETLLDFQARLWSGLCDAVGLVVADLPGMKKTEQGQNTRPTNGFDSLRWAMPCYVLPNCGRYNGQEFDREYYGTVAEGYYQAIKSTWHLDEQRVEQLRKIFPIKKAVGS